VPGNPKDNGLLPAVQHPIRTKRQTCAGRSKPREPDATYGEATESNALSGAGAIARTLNMPVENVRLVSPFIGGGFGGKLWVNAGAILAAIASRQLRRPVKTALTRQQTFQVTTHRSDTIQRIRFDCDQDAAPSRSAVIHCKFPKPTCGWTQTVLRLSAWR
jgi:CO/xanthine dehydrogenase Mo-binding subunit